VRMLIAFSPPFASCRIKLLGNRDVSALSIQLSSAHKCVRHIVVECPMTRWGTKQVADAAREARLFTLQISECGWGLGGDFGVKVKHVDEPGCRVTLLPCSCSSFEGMRDTVKFGQAHFVI
jgi:hypothetical protein